MQERAETEGYGPKKETQSIGRQGRRSMWRRRGHQNIDDYLPVLSREDINPYPLYYFNLMFLKSLFLSFPVTHSSSILPVWHKLPQGDH